MERGRRGIIIRPKPDNAFILLMKLSEEDSLCLREYNNKVELIPTPWVYFTYNATLSQLLNLVGKMKGLLLDLDGTLVDDKAAMRQALDALVIPRPELFLHIDMVDNYALWDRISAKHWQAYEAGDLSFQDQRRYRLREFLQQPLSDDEADQLFAVYTKAYEGSVTILPGVVEFFERTEHVPKAVVTNGVRSQQLRKLQKSNLLNRVKSVITSEDCGVQKPHPRIFELAAESIGIPLGECFMIGDDFRRDIEPAKKFGMKYFHVVQGDPERTILGALENL